MDALVPSPLARGLRDLLPAGVRGDAPLAGRCALVIAPRLIIGGLALAAFPVYLAMWGAPSLAGAVLFALMASPLGIIVYLSRTGRLERAQLLSAFSLSGLVAYGAALTGGPLSPLLAWIVAVPAEAALWGSRRVMLAATAMAAAAVAAVAGAALAGILPDGAALAGPAWAMVALGALPAALYVGALALAREALAGEAAAAAERAEAPYRTLVDEGPDIVTRHRRNGNVTYASPAAARELGVAQDALTGCGLFRLIHVLDRPAYLKALDEAIAGGEATVELRLRALGEAAGWLWMEMRCRGLPGEAGAGQEVVAALRDVTRLKAQEQGLTEAFERSERKSLDKTRFLARISHELRTPLNAIIGFSEILRDAPFGTLDDEQQREYAGLIRDSGCHLLDLINDILDMSKIEAGSFRIVREPFDLAALIENCRQMLAPQAAAGGLTLESDLPVDLPELVADRRACKQMLLNLLHNAVKFSHRGGRIVVGAYVEEDHVGIYVADEGIGIARDDLKRIGQPFVQLQSSYDRNYEGAGLGLSVVKGLVALHGGSLEIDSTPNVGTRVSLRLPMAAASPAAAAPEEAPELPFRMTA